MPDYNATAPYRTKHIATDPLHIVDEPRYAVLDAKAEVVSTHKWSSEAADEARRLSIDAGACAECGGDGTVISDWTGGPEGEIPFGGECSRCGGTGQEPDA